VAGVGDGIAGMAAWRALMGMAAWQALMGMAAWRAWRR
jgi:hypothetical protein